ncbi:MAG: SpoIIE family protein phosphatase [Firmicutes bacterium]|uniref:SpoIIE family protein phosphatase n=1 Tax=Candidatus Alloenteromonas pullistercoris TaxID=2840785 RepID=A0A9D9GW66_9FIRM|nr:SpoIIE family protein phosphatase [Candidatus Enteromonas pullistercoris]
MERSEQAADITSLEGQSELESGYLSVNHKGEELCGDHVQIVKGEDGSTTLVLADGLGSGVVASILSTLTSAMLSRMAEAGLSIEDGVETLVKTLPIARDRGNVAYSTFTVCRIEPDYSAVVYNFDNPDPVFLRLGKQKELDYRTLEVEGKLIKKAECYFDVNDELVMFSDGAVHAGVGETLNFGWTRDEIVAYLEGLVDPSVSAKNVSTLLVDHCDLLYNRRPGDDTTALTVRRRERKKCNLMVGPPTNKEDDEKVLSRFFSLEGPHIVCGGTTCSLAARYLHSPIEGSLDYLDPEVPPISYIRGVDLATEGIITLNKVLSLSKDYQGQNKAYFDWSFRSDGASQIAKMLFEEATDIDFYVGCAVNPAHQDPQYHIGFKMKMQIIDNLAQELRNMGKHIKVTYF